MTSRIVNFRASDELAEAISGSAKQSNLSTSEWLRQLAAQRAEATKMETPIHTRAALGDGEAMSVLADCHYRQALDGSVPQVSALAEARVYARLAAMARGTREDWLSFVYVGEHYASALREAGFGDMADKAQAEAVAIAEHMGEDGDEEVARMVVASAEKISPAVMALAGGLYDYSKGILDDANGACSTSA